MVQIKFFKLFYLLVTLVVAAVNSQGSNNLSLRGILTGTTTTQATVPYVARIDNTSGTGGRKICSAVIIAVNFVLTAASCIDRIDPSFLTVRAGVTDLLGTTGSSHSVAGYRVHESYVATGSTTNNIAVVKVSPAFVFDAQIAAIDYTSTTVVGTDVSVLVRSWQVNEYVSTVLPQATQFQTTKTISNSQCHTVFAQVSSTDICTNRLPFTGLCRFDEGGPVTNVGETELIGINTVTNIGCSIVGLPNVHTRVSSYVTWIQTKMTELA